MIEHPTDSSRRDFMRRIAGGGLLLCIGTPVGAEAHAGDPPGVEPVTVNGWVRIAPNGKVAVLTNSSEIGQGTGTALAQLLAEELDLDWRSVHLEMAPLEPRYFNPRWRKFATYGSGGVSGQFAALRTAGAQARAMLVAAAAHIWEVRVADCSTASGELLHAASGRRLGYGALASAAALQPVPTEGPRLPTARPSATMLLVTQGRRTWRRAPGTRAQAEHRQSSS